MGKKKKKAKAPKEIDVLHYDSKKNYTMVEVETMLDQIVDVTVALDADLKAMEAESAFCETTKDYLDLTKRERDTWKAKSDLMSTFAHLSLDLGKRHRKQDEEKFKQKVKAMEDKLRNELEEKFKRLKQKIT